MTHPTDEELDALVKRMERITGHKYASRDQCLLNCELGTISLGDVADLCAAIAKLRLHLDSAHDKLEIERALTDGAHRRAREAAPHVNETPKSEHDAGNVLTPQPVTDDLVARLRANGLDECDEAIAIITTLKVDLAKGVIDYCHLMERHDELHNALAAERAKVERLVDAMKALEKAAAEVSRRGAETGPQWTKLTVALLQARAALAASLPAADLEREGPDNFERLVRDGIEEAIKAMRKFPQPNYIISKIAEEAGEVVKAAIHCAEGRETPENLRGEMKQLIAMLYRLWIEGDRVHGLGSVSSDLAQRVKE